MVVEKLKWYQEEVIRSMNKLYSDVVIPRYGTIPKIAGGGWALTGGEEI